MRGHREVGEVVVADHAEAREHVEDPEQLGAEQAAAERGVERGEGLGGGGAAVELGGELGDLGATAGRERREHEGARVDLRREVFRDGALVEVGEDAGLVERGVRGDDAGAIAVEAERERGGDRDAVEDLVGVLDPLLRRRGRSRTGGRASR